ncbi:MAG: hypothetical protein C4318_02285 [Acidimicrobiia bacterium]
MDLDRRDFLKTVGAFGAGFSLLGCGLFRSKGSTTEVLQVGAIGLFPGDRRKYKGELPEDALRAAVGRLNALGGILGRQVAFRGAHAGTVDEAFEGFMRLVADPTVVGIILATPLAADTIADEAGRLGVPIISATVDFTLSGGLYPEDAQRETLFQFAIPTQWSLQVLLDYCRFDRGYSTVGAIYDEISFPGFGEVLANLASASGVRVAWSEEFGRGGVSLSDQLSAAASAAPQALYLWGFPEAAAKTAVALAELGLAYESTPKAKSSSAGSWHPHLMGSPEAMSERDWATAAGSAARPGTVSVGDIGGFRKGPEWLPEIWGRDHVLGWEKKDKARRGLRSVVDSTYVLLEAARRAGKPDREAVLSTLGQRDQYQFASVAFELGGDKRVALEPDDLCVMVLEDGKPAPANPPYELGTEWSEGLMEERDMTVLVRPRLEANLRRAGQIVTGMLSNGYGTQCSKLAPGRLSPACSVH